MKNKDMPSSPTAMIDSHDLRNDGLDESGRYLISNGLTKREIIAMHADVSKVNDFDNYKEMALFMGEKWRVNPSDLGKLNLKLRVTAKLKVMHADALLAELEK